MRILAVAFALLMSVSAAKADDLIPQMGFVFEDTQAVVLNSGGKRRVIETMRNNPTAFFKGEIPRVAEGSTCTAKKDGLIVFIGLGAKPDTVRVRYVQPAMSDGECPFGTLFDLNKVMYELARNLYKKSEM